MSLWGLSGWMIEGAEIHSQPTLREGVKRVGVYQARCEGCEGVSVW